MANKTVTAGLVIFFVLLILPGFQMITHVFPEATIIGVVPKTKPRLSWTRWFDGTLQQKGLAWFEQKAGLMSYLIKIDSQISFTVFGEASPRSNIIVGKQDYLFTEPYVLNSQDLHVLSVEKIEPKVLRLKALQRLLARQGISFVLVISPNKARLYAEYVPARYLVVKKKSATTYNHTVFLLKKHKINYVDGPEYFSRFKNVSNYPLFPHSGIHWSYYGACRFSKIIVQELERQMSKDLGELDCNNGTASAIPIGTDRDLGDLMNVWTFQSLKVYPNFVPNLTVQHGPNTFKPAILYIGDSFTKTLLSTMDGTIQSRSEFFAYNRVCLRFPGDGRTPIVREPTILRKHILSEDAVIIQIQESGILKTGFGFVENALSALQPAKYGHLFKRQKPKIPSAEIEEDTMQLGFDLGEDASDED